MKREKLLQINRQSRDATAAQIAGLRERVDDPEIKGRLRALEDKLAVCPPSAEPDAAVTDNEIKSLVAEFMDVYAEGILTERYLERIEMLVAKRARYL